MVLWVLNKDYNGERIWYLSTVGCACVCFIISLLFVWELSPQNDSCASSRYTNLVSWASCVFGVIICSSYLAWYLFSYSRSKASMDAMSQIGQVYTWFYDRWIYSTAVFTVFAVFVQLTVQPPLQAHSWSNTGQMTTVAVEIWANSYLFNDTIRLFKEKCPEIGAQWYLNFLPQHVLILTSIIMTVSLFIVTGVDPLSTTNGAALVKVSLFFRLAVRVYQVIAFSILIKIINKFHQDLLDAVVNSSVTGRKVQVVDSPFHLNESFVNGPRTTAGNEKVFGRVTAAGGGCPMGYDVESKDRQYSTATLSRDTTGSARPSNVTAILMKDLPRNDYTQIFKEAERMLDLLKMVVTFNYISAISSCVDIQLQIDGTFSTDILDATLQLTIVLLPWVYFLCYHVADNVSIAVAHARHGCILFLMFSVYFVMAMIGGYLGCDFLEGTTFNHSKGKQFLLYMVKTTALPTTVSLAFIILSSPGVRRWSGLPLYVQMVVAPLVWMPQYTLQELHEAFGANFGLMGLIHAVGWIIMLCLKMFTLTDTGVLIAAITGILMLLACVKLLWPPGKSIPHISETSSKLYKRFDAFLRDSKYGYYHVYLAYSVIVMYCLHGIFAMENSKNWYFFTVIICFVISMRSHPAKRYWFHRPLHALGYTMDKWTVIDKQVTELRGKGLCAVTLMLQMPSNANAEHFKGGGDVIHVQNRSGFVGKSISNFLTRSLETTHYFSVVSLELVDENGRPMMERKPSTLGSIKSDATSNSHLQQITSALNTTFTMIQEHIHKQKCYAKVQLMIQRTGRTDGASSAMVEPSNSTNKDGVHYDFRVLGFVKSHSLEAMHLPCVIAFGYESGSAAFCSLLRERMRMRTHVEDSSKRVRVSELTDICVIWCQFMKKPRGRDLVPGDVVKAVKELVAMQEFLYSNSGGRGVKMLFVCTGVPQEWTPDPESIVHRTKSFESDVAKALNVKMTCCSPMHELNDETGRMIWGSTVLTNLGGSARNTIGSATPNHDHTHDHTHNNQNEIANNNEGRKSIGGTASKRPSANSEMNSSIRKVSSASVRSSLHLRSMNTSEGVELKRVSFVGDKPFSASNSRNTSVSDGRVSVLNVLLQANNSGGKQAADVGASPTSINASPRDNSPRDTPDPLSSSSSSSATPSDPLSLSGAGRVGDEIPTKETFVKRTDLSGIVEGLNEDASMAIHTEDDEEEDEDDDVEEERKDNSDSDIGVERVDSDSKTISRDIRSPQTASILSDLAGTGFSEDSRLLRATIMSNPGTLSGINHHFGDSLDSSKKTDPAEMLVRIQQHPESWVPLRNALGSNWSYFKKLLDYRIGAACSWLNSPNGPDYTSLFVTEHSSDVALLRDFKYSEVYDGKIHIYVAICVGLTT
jgi:hypothetical protein